jgi:hypothetical protein
MNRFTRMTAWTALALVVLAGIDATYVLPTLHDSARLLPAVEDVMIGTVGMCTPCDTLDGSLNARPMLDVATLLTPPCGVA